MCTCENTQTPLSNNTARLSGSSSVGTTSGTLGAARSGSYIDEMDKRRLRVFDYYPPTSPEVARKHELVRAACKHLAETLLMLAPVSFERESALNSVDQTMMWANAAIARNQ